jgi:hypothetical protein
VKTRLAVTSLVVFLYCVASSQVQQRQLLPGRYFTPDTLSDRLKSAATERPAQFYLMGAYDLVQDSGQSCAARGTTTPAQLEQIFSQYLQAHSELMHADRTAASVTAQAFAEYWPCQAPGEKPTANPESRNNNAASDTLPSVVGQCTTTTVSKIGTRLTEGTNGPNVPDSGSMIFYSNGGGQVSYETIPGIEHSRVGDKVFLCLVSIPPSCPPGDDRGKWYTAKNLRTGASWDLPNSEHDCGGA